MANAVSLNPETVARIVAKMAEAGVSENDIEETFIRGSGSGGQKINKTSSCVQLLYKPDGTVMRCQETRSREANRWLVRRMLVEKLLEARQSELSAKIQAIEKIRRQKRRKSRKQRAKMLADKRIHSEKKKMRAPVRED